MSPSTPLRAGLEGRHAVVTGATRGIGLAIAQALAARGARVSVINRSGGRGDVRREADVRDAFAACRAANGPVEILVNNAGVVESAPLTRTTTELWQRLIDTNLTGTFFCMREVLAEMLAAGWGRIVNVASTAGLQGAPYIAAYCAAKHGAIGLTRAAAAEVAGSGVTINAICPGYTETEILRSAVRNIMAKTGRDERSTRELLAQSNPEGRFATVDEVAQGVLDLISGTASGAALIVPGFTFA